MDKTEYQTKSEKFSNNSQASVRENRKSNYSSTFLLISAISIMKKSFDNKRNMFVCFTKTSYEILSEVF